MQTLSLHDVVTIRIDDDSKNNFRLTCSNPSLPTDDRNLVTRAAKFMISEYGITQPIHIHLEKNIPIAAGLGGGSSDCAATLTGINNLFDLRIPLHTEEQFIECTEAQFIKCTEEQLSLAKIGQRFGADVPFCLVGGTALAEGIGEKLTPLSSHPQCYVLLACPDIPVSTKEIFGMYTPPITRQNCIPTMIQAINDSDLNQIADNFSNDLTHITARIHPKINTIINEMKNQGALNAAMSGSGPSVFGYFTDKGMAEKAQKELAKIAIMAFLTNIRGR